MSKEVYVSGWIDETFGEFAQKLKNLIQEEFGKSYKEMSAKCKIITQSLHPVNPRNWLTFECETENGKKIYFQLHTHETEWGKKSPVELELRVKVE